MNTTRAKQEYDGQALYVALETSAKKWLLVCGDGARRSHKECAAWDCEAVGAQIEGAKAKFGLAADAPVHSCYEAGRDGFSIHRWLASIGVNNRVVDSASIEVPQRGKRVKSDRIDGDKLHDMLVRVCRGDCRVWREVRVPEPQDEDLRRVHRERERLKKEAARLGNAIKGLLATQGLRMTLQAGFAQALKAARCWDGAGLGDKLQAELLRMWWRLRVVQRQIKAVEREQARQVAREDDARMQQMRQLQQLRGIGAQTPWVLCTEVFGWREIGNGRQLGALAGLTPTPYNSGASQREQGISKAGIRRLRPAMVELAWLWLQYQPGSELSRWFETRFGTGSKRSRRIGIVALARKLLVALWRYLHEGVIPAGAVLKPAA